MRSILLFTCLLTTTAAFGQKFHELKTDLVLPFVQVAHLAYEFVPTKNIGIEAGFWYSWAEDGGYIIPGDINEPESEGTFVPQKQQVIIATVSAKYYLFRPAPGSGAYLGGYVREDVLTSKFRPQYPYIFLNNYGGDDYNPPNRFLRFATGLQVGYKYVIGRHFLAEASVGFDIDPFEKHPFYDWAGIPGVRLGYRF